MVLFVSGKNPHGSAGKAAVLAKEKVALAPVVPYLWPNKECIDQHRKQLWLFVFPSKFEHLTPFIEGFPRWRFEREASVELQRLPRELQKPWPWSCQLNMELPVMSAQHSRIMAVVLCWLGGSGFLSQSPFVFFMSAPFSPLFTLPSSVWGVRSIARETGDGQHASWNIPFCTERRCCLVGPREDGVGRAKLYAENVREKQAAWTEAWPRRWDFPRERWETFMS